MNRFFIFTLFIFPNISFGKCTTEYQTVSGKLLNGMTPLANVVVTVEFRDGLNGLVTKTSTSDERGHYQIEVGYNKFSKHDFLGRDRCDFILKEFYLKIEGKGIEQFEKIVETSSKKTTYNKSF